MKKLLCLALAAMLCLALAACAVAEGNWKIAILTGTTSQGEEEFRAAERAQKADPEHIVTDTYPDNFMAETETTISKPVSYTHLDVYKRQTPARAKRAGSAWNVPR